MWRRLLRKEINNSKMDVLNAPFCAVVTSGDRPAKSSVYAPWIGGCRIQFYERSQCLETLILRVRFF